MKIINQSIELIQITKNPEQLIELAGRTCYKSEDKITENSAAKFIRMIKEKGHYSVFEHACATFKIITSRAVANEIVRHRIASYSQESTRYVRYTNLDQDKKEICFIKPYKINNYELLLFWEHCEIVEKTYLDLLELGVKPQIARDVLPLALKTELIMTANFREWLHFIKLRSSKAAHPHIRELAIKINNILNKYAPNIFSAINEKEI